MARVLILGANGQLARNTTTVLLRKSHRLRNPDASRVTIVEGDVLDIDELTTAITGHDVVYANLNGALKQQAQLHGHLR